MRERPFYQQTSMIYVVAGIISLVLSCWINIHEAVINPDAICYLLSAELIGQSGLSDGMHICPQANWPFYSAIISLFAKVTHLSLLVSAESLDAVFSLLSVVTFIAIVQRLGGTRIVLWFAALVFLFSHELMSVRQYIVRDHGFWAFYLLSVFFLIHYFEQPRWKSAIAWGVSILLATLFRIEGAIFFLMLPFAAYFLSGSLAQRTSSFLKLFSPVILIIVILGAWLLSHPEQSIKQLGRIAEVTDRSMLAVTNIAQRFDAIKLSLVEHVLPREAVRDAGLVLLLTMVVWYIVNVIQNLSWAAAILVLYAWFGKVTTFSRAQKTVLFSYIAINFAITAVFFAEHLFLSKRYLLALTLILLLWVPFAIVDLLGRAKIWSRQGLVYFLLALLLVPSLGVVFHFGPNKGYIREAGTWMAENVPANASLYSNDYQLLYYSQHFGLQVYQAWRQILPVNLFKDEKWKEYDYLALRVGRHHENQLENQLKKTGLLPVQVFQNNRGEKIVIVRVSRLEKK